ncbi:MAG: BamA/TamA family outer membrane protein [Bacteroidota bacterium]
MSKLPYLLTTFTILLSLLVRQESQANSCEIVWKGDSLAVLRYQNLTSGLSLCDSLNATKSLNEAVSVLNESGYLLAAYSYRSDSTSVVINCRLGAVYRWAQLDIGNIPTLLLSRISRRAEDFTDKELNPKSYIKLIDQIISYSENHGLPFASVMIDSLTVSDRTVFGRLNYEPGPTIKFDSLSLSGSIRTKRSWLESYLGIRHGALYSQKIVDDIERGIAQLPFLDLQETPSISFQNKEATVMLKLVERKVSSADGIVGFLPNEEESGRLLITGQFDLSLQNLFRSGKQFQLKWQSLKARSQFLDITYRHPNVLRSSLDFEADFNLLKEDTLFLTRRSFLGVSYRTNRSRFKVFSQFFSSDLLGTGGAENIIILPESIDLNTISYGLGFEYSNLDLIFTPMSGIYFNVSAMAGTKEIERNSDIPPELYTNVDLSTVQYKMQMSFSAYYRLAQKLVLNSQVRAGGVFNDELFLNDLFRVGGLNSLRGFNENFFFAQRYITGSVELQFHFQENSYIFTFYDQAYLEYDLNTSKFDDYPLGLGLGLSLYTGAGHVNLVYALGRSEEQPLSLNLSKFHFGYVARF